MATILYISLTGMTEALGESQVIQYLLELAKKNKIYLLSFEKPTSIEKYATIQKRLNASGIEWKYLSYSNRYGVFSSGFQMISAFFILRKWIKEKKITIIHARSLIAAMIGWSLKKTTNTKLLFDIRGFAIDEKIVEGRLKPNSLLSKILKRIEAFIYKQADHVVTLTHVSKPIIVEKYNVVDENITVIPTCTNSALFKVLSIEDKIKLRESMGFAEKDVIIIHNGSLNGGVDFEAEIKLFQQLAMLNQDIKFIFLNQGQHDLIQTYLNNYNFNQANYKILSAEFNHVHHYLNLADLGVFFIKPIFAKQASAPTKFAEYVACHLYSVTNKHYGDLEYYFNNYQVGLLLELDEVHHAPKAAADKVLNYISTLKNKSVDTKQTFNELLSEHFSKQIAVERYQHIYNQLINSKG